MRHTAAEKLEFIRLVDGSDLSVKATLKKLGIHKGTFYKWYEKYLQHGLDGLENNRSSHRQVWNRIGGAGGLDHIRPEFQINEGRKFLTTIYLMLKSCKASI